MHCCNRKSNYTDEKRVMKAWEYFNSRVQLWVFLIVALIFHQSEYRRLLVWLIVRITTCSNAVHTASMLAIIIIHSKHRHLCSKLLPCMCAVFIHYISDLHFTTTNSAAHQHVYIWNTLTLHQIMIFSESVVSTVIACTTLVYMAIMIWWQDLWNIMDSRA